MRNLFFLIIVGLLINTYNFSQSLSEKIDAYISSYVNTNDFSGCVLVTRNDSILFSECYGKANFSFNIDNTIETKFKIGSISKQFTAAAILKLEEEGLLNTSDSLAKYFQQKSNVNNRTIHQILTHTSGLVDIYDLPDFYSFSCGGVTFTEIVNMVLDQEPYFKPGERYQYSNGGYVVLARIIELVSNQTYEEFIYSSIFKELGMNSSVAVKKMRLLSILLLDMIPLDMKNLLKPTILII